MSNTPSPNNPQLVTAAQIENCCPIEVQDLGRRLAAHYDKLIKCEDKAEQHKIAIGQLLVQVKQVCDAGGFKAVKERFCPNLGKSRAYELLQVASGKKTIEESKAATRARVNKHRASKKLPTPRGRRARDPEPEPLSVTVTESAEVILSPEEKEKAEFAGWLEAGDAAQKASAQALAEFTTACRAWLPKVTEQSHQYKARHLATKMTQSGDGAAPDLGTAIEREWLETERACETLTAHPIAQIVRVIPPGKVALIAEIADRFTALAARLTALSAGNGEAPVAGSGHDNLSIPHCLQRGAS